jgi:hypothetical protein
MLKREILIPEISLYQRKTILSFPFQNEKFFSVGCPKIHKENIKKYTVSFVIKKKLLIHLFQLVVR